LWIWKKSNGNLGGRVNGSNSGSLAVYFDNCNSMTTPASLVLYEDPIQLNTIGNNNEEESKEMKSSSKTTTGSFQKDEILNSILPPKVWENNEGNKFMQYASKELATRLEVIRVQELLDSRLAERQARDKDICPVREDLYQQCFDELIRQVTLNQPERGLLLLRVRDEARMTVDAYKTLYDSSIVFGIRKQLQAEQGMSDMEEEIKALEEECKSRHTQVLELQNKVTIMEKREIEIRSLLEKKRKDEISFLKYQGQNLDKFLKSVSG